MKRAILLLLGFPLALALLGWWSLGASGAARGASVARSGGESGAAEPSHTSNLWNSALQIQNVGTVTGTVQVTLYDQSGNTVAITSTAGLAPGAAWPLSPLPAPEGFAGSVVIASDVEVRAVLTQLDQLGGNNGAGDTVNAVVAGARKVYLPLMKRGWYGGNTRIYVQNTSPRPAQVTAAYTGAPPSEHAGKTYVEGPLTVPPYASRVLFGEAAAPALPKDNLLASAIVTATEALAVTYNELLDLGGFLTLSSGNGFPEGTQSKKIFVPLVKKFWWGAAIGIQVQNVGTESGTVHVQYQATTDGTGYKKGQIFSSAVQTVPPGASANYYLDPVLPGDRNTLTGFLGSAVITSTQPIVAIVNELGLNGSFGMTHSGFNDGLQTAKIAVPVVKKFWQGATTGIQVQNAGSASTSLFVTYFAASDGAGYKKGQSFTSKLYPGEAVPPGESRTYFLDPVLPGDPSTTQGFFGSAIITATQPIVAIVNELRPAGGDQFSSNGFNLPP